MPNLEYVIRPYQSPRPFGTIVIPSTPTQNRERAVLTWGATAQGTMPTPKTITFQIKCCEENLNEETREVEKVRIFGEVDPSGRPYVDVERVHVVKLNKNERKNCDSPLEKSSYVAQSINSALSGWDAEFSGRTVKPGDECKTTWNLSN